MFCYQLSKAVIAEQIRRSRSRNRAGQEWWWQQRPAAARPRASTCNEHHNAGVRGSTQTAHAGRHGGERGGGAQRANTARERVVAKPPAHGLGSSPALPPLHWRWARSALGVRRSGFKRSSTGGGHTRGGRTRPVRGFPTQVHAEQQTS